MMNVGRNGGVQTEYVSMGTCLLNTCQGQGVRNMPKANRRASKPSLVVPIRPSSYFSSLSRLYSSRLDNNSHRAVVKLSKVPGSHRY